MTALMDVPARTWQRVQFTTIAVTLANIGMGRLTGPHHSMLYAIADAPLGVGAPLVSVASAILYMARNHRDRVALAVIESERAANAELERAWRADVYRLAVPDPAPDQCPVCGLDDLASIVQADAYCGDSNTPMARVVAYGPVFAHRECAQVVPYERYYMNTPACRRRLGIPESRDRPWTQWGVIQQVEYWTSGVGSRGWFKWTCHNCTANGLTPTLGDAEAALRWHAQHCLARAMAQERTGSATRIKAALAPNEDPAQWLHDALRSSDPGVRNAAWAVICTRTDPQTPRSTDEVDE